MFRRRVVPLEQSLAVVTVVISAGQCEPRQRPGHTLGDNQIIPFQWIGGAVEIRIEQPALYIHNNTAAHHCKRLSCHHIRCVRIGHRHVG